MNPPVTTQSILNSVARRMGLVPDENLSPDQAAEILQAMDDRLREAWEMFDFLENTLTEERAFRNDYDTSLCYNVGDTVWDPVSRLYYAAAQTGVGGPLSNPALWTSSPSVVPAYIEWFQVGKIPIGTPFEAWTDNPFEVLTAKKRAFVISQRGLEFVPNQVGTTMWIYYRVPYPGLGQDNWVATVTYLANEPVLGSDGHTYISLIDGMGTNPVGDTTGSWKQFPVPYTFSRFVITAAFSDTLITNGQNEKAQAEESKAYAYLNQELDKQKLQMGQVDHFSVNV
jgi:hypothetical protein